MSRNKKIAIIGAVTAALAGITAVGISAFKRKKSEKVFKEVEMQVMDELDGILNPTPEGEFQEYVEDEVLKNVVLNDDESTN